MSNKINGEVEGFINTYEVTSDGQWLPKSAFHNQVQWSWGEIACKLFGEGAAEYKISGMYIEFENVASSGDAVTPPSFDRSEGIEYYSALSSSPSRDFLRVQLVSSPVASLIPGYEGSTTTSNQLTFYAQSSGSIGIHGKTFSTAANSKVFGLALVATPKWADRTRDLIFAREYYPTAQQVLKQTSSQIGVSWTEQFK
jgi:hypothetical protein